MPRSVASVVARVSHEVIRISGEVGLQFDRARYYYGYPRYSNNEVARDRDGFPLSLDHVIMYRRCSLAQLYIASM
jgi:hypothetical protein